MFEIDVRQAAKLAERVGADSGPVVTPRPPTIPSPVAGLALLGALPGAGSVAAGGAEPDYASPWTEALGAPREINLGPDEMAAHRAPPPPAAPTIDHVEPEPEPEPAPAPEPGPAPSPSAPPAPQSPGLLSSVLAAIGLKPTFERGTTETGEPGGAVRAALHDGDNLKLLSGSATVGKSSGPGGSPLAGAGAEGGLLRLGSGPPGSKEHGGTGWPVGLDVGLGTASAGLMVNESTASLALQANLLEGGATFGNERHSLRLGGSISAGAGLRFHAGDADKNGIREMGMGVDVGPLSGDFKTELLGRIFNWMTGASPSPEAAPEAAPPVDDEDVLRRPSG